MNIKKIFSNPISSLLLTLLTCALWGSLFPFIKKGYAAFHIDSGDIPSIMLFAGMRFAVSGIIMIVLFSAFSKKLLAPKKDDMAPILSVALMNIVLHYAFTYMALAIGEGSKSAIVKQIGFLILSCFSFVFVKDDHFTVRKLVCGILGFLGIVATAVDGTSVSFALGDLMLLVASMCSVACTVITKKAVAKTSPLTLVAYSQLIGGVVLCAAGLALGGKITHFDMNALMVFLYICASSIAAYCIWNVLVKYNSISKLSVIKFSETLFAVIFSGIMLGENIFRPNYVAALVLIFVSILFSSTNIGSRKRKDV